MYVNDGLMAQLIYAFVTSRLDYWNSVLALVSFPGTRVANRVPGNEPGNCYPVFIHFVLKW